MYYKIMQAVRTRKWQNTAETAETIVYYS